MIIIRTLPLDLINNDLSIPSIKVFAEKVITLYLVY